ncbi:sugar-binding protein [Pseudomonas sp. 13B_2.1_Bac1]|uniref:RHS repeat-associated core domain-containing protein n=1 Tax=Pseudomonas sp. 13B_2.1_Bac1 TaxID=2971624 RepID=UPI0021CAA8E5|nr:RHS repeat-associated core domain-containing protein [Pseudomonas sp. 13B_2.1_Bac1]MCU1783847.1 sugar-binding protein [Pseudomonas sp. 13B_2.1_Bac1]
MSTSLHRNTPTLKAMDPRGLAVRAVHYHRESVTQTPQARVTRQVFGANGLLLSQWDPRQFARGAAGVASQSTIYSLSGEPVRTESADAGWRLLIHGEAGQLLHRWDSRLAHHERRYDRLLRPVAVFEQAANEPRPRCVERLTYAAAEPAEAAGNRCGRLIRHADPAGVLSMDEYGIGGSVTQQTRRFRLDTSGVDWPSSDDQQAEQLEPKAHTTTWRYDALGAQLEQVDAQGNRRHWLYGQQGWLKEVALTLRGGSRQVLTHQRVYNASGLVISERMGNGVTKLAKYAAEDNRLLQLTVHRKGEAAKPLQDLVYEYDPVGNILSLSDQAQPTQWHSNARIDAVNRYQYDSLYQLTQATGRENAGNSGGQAAPGRLTFGATDTGLWRNYTQHYRYDEHGNLTSLRHVPSSGAGHTRDMRVAAGSNRAMPVTDGAPRQWAMMFDANGNQHVLGSGQQLGWNVRNQLTHVTQVWREQGDPDVESYLYDGQGQRAAKIRSQQVAGKPHTQLTCYLPGLRLHVQAGKRLNVLEIDTGGGHVTVLQWEQGRPSDMKDEHVQFSLLDHLNSSLLELDEQAQLLSQEHYYPYGTTAWWATNDTQRARYKVRRYAGKERDATGLYYYGLRYYAPWLQRWISPDPLGDVDGLNLYAMTLGNPLRFKDEDGGQATFGEQFQPGRGDIIFGLAGTVRSYRSFWSKLSARGDTMAAYFSGADIQHWTAQLGATVGVFSKFREHAPDEFRDLVTQKRGEYPAIQRLKTDLIEQISVGAQPVYQGILSKYSGCMATTSNQQFVRKFVADLAAGKYSVEATARQYIGESLLSIQQKLVSRSSKSALETLTQPQSTAVVHFALDDLDIGKVISKSQRATTGSELRWLYRHRVQLAGRVIFYQGQAKVDAPWETHPAQWRAYGPRSTNATARAGGRR